MVKVEWARLAKEWARSEHVEVSWELRTTKGSADPTRPGVDGVRVANERLDDGRGTLTEGIDPVPGPKGLVGFVQRTGNEEDVQLWFATLAEHLHAQGVTGTISVPRSLKVYDFNFPMDGTSAITTLLALTPSEPNQWGDHRLGRPDDQAELARFVPEWLSPLPPPVGVLRGLHYFAAPVETAGRELVKIADVENWGSVLAFDGRSRHVRCAGVTWSGVSFNEADPGQSVEQLLDTARGLLRRWGARSQVGVVVRHRALADWQTAEQNLTDVPRQYRPPIRLGAYLGRPNLHDTLVPDITGLMLLADTHVERITDLTGWHLSDLGGGKHLLEPDDPTPWWSGPHPDLETLHHARRQFASLLWQDSSPPVGR